MLRKLRTEIAEAATKLADEQVNRRLKNKTADHHIGRQAISPSLKLLDHLGLIDQMPNSPS